MKKILTKLQHENQNTENRDIVRNTYVLKFLRDGFEQNRIRLIREGRSKCFNFTAIFPYT